VLPWLLCRGIRRVGRDAFGRLADGVGEEQARSGHIALLGLNQEGSYDFLDVLFSHAGKQAGAETGHLAAEWVSWTTRIPCNEAAARVVGLGVAV